MVRKASIFLVFLAACAAGGKPRTGTDPVGSSDGGTGNRDVGTSDVPEMECEAPDMLIVLDRTLSMHKTPDGDSPSNTEAGRARTKWTIAVTAIESFVAPIDDTLRFGLELFPRDPGGGLCVTLGQRLDGQGAHNQECEAGELVVTPALDTGDAIAAAIDVEATTLCQSTPIALAFGTASGILSDVRAAGRDQYVVLVTDGRETCSDAALLTAVQDMAAAGIDTWVIGFDRGGAIDVGTLNKVACAGRTAPGFPGPCQEQAPGRWTATNPGGETLFMQAEDGPALTASLRQVAQNTCCGCIL